MKNFFKRHINCIPIFIFLACILSIYGYNAFNKDIPVSTGDTGAVSKVCEFNSLVPGVFILSENGEDYRAVGSVFSCVGLKVIEGSFEDFKELKQSNVIFLLPQKEAEKIKAEEYEYINKRIKAGQKVITWGQSPLSESFGISFPGGNKEIDGYVWSSKRDTPILFENPLKLELFSSEESLEVLAEDVDKNPVMVTGSYGSGDFIYSGIPLVSSGGSGYDHFPFLMEAIMVQFGVTPVFARDDLALYVDIDYHVQESPAEVAERIKSYGADQINLSAWYSLEDYGNTYKKLIEECHKRGISVFAWFEMPYVSIDFWDKHPEWREKTASGEDAHVDWRRLMALSNSEALNEVKEYTRDMIMQFDWDGVDIAEIYFESPGAGFKNSDKFTPMNDSFRRSFQERYGIDPIKAFDPNSIYYWKYHKGMKNNIINYRVELITNLHEEFLMLCEEIKEEKPYLRTSVTVIDSIADKGMREDIGVDAEAIAGLQDKYHFLLQIEDPFTLWNLGPDRYKVIGEEYRNIVSEGNDLSIDINVIDRMGEVYPTSKQRGVELYQLINNAGRYTDKVILYALATLEKDDMKFVPYTTCNDIGVQEISKDKYIIRADKRFIWSTDTEGKTFFLDGRKWPFVSARGVIIPGGEHRLEVQDVENDSGFLIEGVNGEIYDVSQDKSISFCYTSEGRFYMIVNRRPSLIEIDGSSFDPEIMESHGKYTIILPNGKHKVRLN